MTNPRILTIGYIGNGKSTNRYHMPFALARPSTFRVKTVYNPRIHHDAWAAVPGVTYTEDLDALLSDPEIDVIEVCTPSKLHFEQAKLALEAGKHVTVDKPFAATEAEAAELFDLAAARGVTVQCYQNRRFDSDYVTARRVFDSGKLGQVFEVVTSYDYYRPWMMADAPFDRVNSAAYGHGSHCLDQLIAWFGEPSRVHADLRQLNGPGRANDYFDYDLYYDDLGIKATAHANYRSAVQRPSFEIYGERGCYIKVDKDSQERDLKHFYLPAGHDDFGLDAPEQYGVLRWYDDDGRFHEERVVSERTSYAQFYDALYETVAHGAPQLVTREQTLAQMRILEEGMRGLR